MSTTESVLVAMTDLVCCIVHRNFKGTCVHYDVTTFCYVSETANRLRLLYFTSTLRSGDGDGCMYVVVDSEYHHHIEVGHSLKKCFNKISTFCIFHSKAESLMRTVHQNL